MAHTHRGQPVVPPHPQKNFSESARPPSHFQQPEPPGPARAVTVSFPVDWRETLGGMKASQRATTSSRRPGRVSEGVVYSVAETHEPCPACGGQRPLGTEVHAPHWRTIAGRPVMVDCREEPCRVAGAGAPCGEEVPPKPEVAAQALNATESPPGPLEDE